jgi:hypothetical protein
MRLFLVAGLSGYRLDESDSDYRDEVMATGQLAEVKLLAFLKINGSNAKASGTCLVAIKTLHQQSRLDDHIKQFDMLWKTHAVQDPAPLTSINQLKSANA